MGKRWEKPEMVHVYVPSLCTQKVSKLIFVSLIFIYRLIVSNYI